MLMCSVLKQEVRLESVKGLMRFHTALRKHHDPQKVTDTPQNLRSCTNGLHSSESETTFQGDHDDL